MYISQETKSTGMLIDMFIVRVTLNLQATFQDQSNPLSLLSLAVEYVSQSCPKSQKLDKP